HSENENRLARQFRATHPFSSHSGTPPAQRGSHTGYLRGQQLRARRIALRARLGCVPAPSSCCHLGGAIERNGVQHGVEFIAHPIKLLIETSFQIREYVQQPVEQIVNQQVIELVEDRFNTSENLVELRLKSGKNLGQRLAHLVKETIDRLFDLVQ